MSDKLQLLEKAVYIMRRCDFSWGKHVFFTAVDDLTLQCADMAKRCGAAGIGFWVRTEAERAQISALGFHVFQEEANGAEESLLDMTDQYGFHLIVETTGTQEAYERLIRLVRRGGTVALVKPLPKPFYFHVCDVIRDQVHFIGIQEADARSREIARQIELKQEPAALRS